MQNRIGLTASGANPSSMRLASAGSITSRSDTDTRSQPTLPTVPAIRLRCCPIQATMFCLFITTAKPRETISRLRGLDSEDLGGGEVLPGLARVDFDLRACTVYGGTTAWCVEVWMTKGRVQRVPDYPFILGMGICRSANQPGPVAALQAPPAANWI